MRNICLNFFFSVYVKPKTIQNLLNMLVQLTLQFMSHLTILFFGPFFGRIVTLREKGVKRCINYSFSEKNAMLFAAKTVLYEDYIGKI